MEIYIVVPQYWVECFLQHYMDPVTYQGPLQDACQYLTSGHRRRLMFFKQFDFYYVHNNP